MSVSHPKQWHISGLRRHHRSQSDLHSSRTVLHPHHPHWPGADAFKTKDPGTFHLFQTQQKARFKQWFFCWCTSCCFSGRLLCSAGFRLHDDEPHVHRTRLDERREAEARRSLKKSSQILLHPPNGKQYSASCEETLTSGETTLVSSRNPGWPTTRIHHRRCSCVLHTQLKLKPLSTRGHSP